MLLVGGFYVIRFLINFDLKCIGFLGLGIFDMIYVYLF